MNKTNLLTGLDGDEKILISHIMDLAERCEKTGVTMYSPFLNPREVSIAMQRCKGEYAVDSFGGYDGAERQVLAFVPYGDEPSYPVCAINVTSRDGVVHSHRDYLGALLSLGLKREKLGDIITQRECAIVFCHSTVCDYICMNLSTVSSSTVVCATCDISDLCVERKFESKDVSVASLRLDGVVSSAIGKSRESASELINRGYVQVNYDIAKSVSARIKSGDVISVRGFGKMVVQTDCQTTKKGRIKITIKKFV